MKEKIKNYIWEKLEEDMVKETKNDKMTNEGFVKGGFVTEKEAREVFQEILQILEKKMGIKWMNLANLKDEETKKIIDDTSQKAAQEYFDKKAKAEFPYFFPNS
jgi:polyhydroxyalkanoate synthesis regulator phasin